MQARFFSAHFLTRSSEAEREELLIDFIRSYVKKYMRPENPSPVLVYGDNSAASRFHSEWLARRLERIWRERKTLSAYVPQTVSVEEPGFDYFEHFCFTIADHAKEIWILELSGYTVEPLIKDTLNKGHFSIKDTCFCPMLIH